MKYKYVLFDLDGTVLDTNLLILDSFKYVFKTHLNKDVEDSELLQYFGEPLITTLERYSEEQAQTMFSLYRNYNEKKHDAMVKVFNGMEDCLKSLSEMGAIMAIVTSKRKKLAVHGLELFGLEKYFTEFIAMEDTEKHKPNPDPILKALEKLNADKTSCIMIGDSTFDIDCAKNAGVDSILVDWSMAKTSQNQSTGADYTVTTPKDILKIVAGLK